MRSRQRGAALIVSLLMLVAMTMLALATVNTSSVNLLIVGNMQERAEIDAAAAEAIEIMLSSYNNFDPPLPAHSREIAGWDVEIAQPECRSVAPAEGYSATFELAPLDTIWWVNASVNSGGGSIEMNQGVRINMIAGSCED
jgi:hypothetical protein